MHAGIKNKGLFARPASDLSARSLPGIAPEGAPSPDASLSAAVKAALGGKSGEAHLPPPALKTGQEIARQARAQKPGAPQKGAPRKAHIGPRSGHK